ncbi:glutamic acid-rich protein-like [Aricia agestis]|uniref:glutamic acid-rich protein-like n=1 Tax=Aricia agestis TaxID=91739 RepID=UPI001C2026F2|nr:glutamic acid-rich protein-like [Aricia agestis]
MKRILCATIFLFNFSIFQSLHATKYKNRAHEMRDQLFDALEDGIRPRRQLFKSPTGKSNWRRADKHSSSIEKMKYQDEFRELHEQKKKEAFQAGSVETDEVNMVAARPAGVPCGDPDQHDMPWGNCMRPEKCPPEYRIYRGDYACGYTTYVCCALQLTGDDTIVPLDASFGSDFEEDEKKKVAKKKKHSSSKKSRKLQDRRRREEERKKRKKRMERIIKRITRRIKKAFKGDSKVRKRKTREFKKFLKRLKRKYDESRLLVRDRHREVLNKTDREREERLKEIYKKNKEFIRDVTNWRPEVRVSAEASEDVTETPDDREVNAEDDKEVNAEDDREVNAEDDREVRAEGNDEVNTEPSRRRTLPRHDAHGYLNRDVGGILFL